MILTHLMLLIHMSFRGRNGKTFRIASVYATKPFGQKRAFVWVHAHKNSASQIMGQKRAFITFFRGGDTCIIYEEESMCLLFIERHLCLIERLL